MFNQNQEDSRLNDALDILSIKLSEDEKSKKIEKTIIAKKQQDIVDNINNYFNTFYNNYNMKKIGSSFVMPYNISNGEPSSFILYNNGYAYFVSNEKDLVDYKKCFCVFLKDLGHFKSLLGELNIK